MTLTPSPLARLGRAVGRIGATLIGLVLALAGFLLMIGALLVGLAAAAGLFIWAALRGRPAPPMAFRWHRTDLHGVPRRGRGAAPADDTEVIDVQVRELPRTPRD